MRMMIAWAALAVGAAPAAAQTIDELCQRVRQMPAVGEWAQYRITSDKGVMEIRMAIVGKEAVSGKDHYWMEMKTDAAQGQMIVQTLISVFPYDQADIQAMVMKMGGQPAMKVSGSMLSAMRGMMSQAPNPGETVRAALEKCNTAEIVGRETITVPAGSMPAIHFRATAVGDKGEGWVSPDVSGFGIVKMIWSEGGGGEMVLLGHGKDAKSSITETPQEMPGMPRGRN